MQEIAQPNSSEMGGNKMEATFTHKSRYKVIPCWTSLLDLDLLFYNSPIIIV